MCCPEEPTIFAVEELRGEQMGTVSIPQHNHHALADDKMSSSRVVMTAPVLSLMHTHNGGQSDANRKPARAVYE